MKKTKKQIVWIVVLTAVVALATSCRVAEAEEYPASYEEYGEAATVGEPDESPEPYEDDSVLVDEVSDRYDEANVQEDNGVDLETYGEGYAFVDEAPDLHDEAHMETDIEANIQIGRAHV